MPRFASVALFALLPAGAALAQADSQTLAALRACQPIEQDAARLACFDDALAPAARDADAAAPAPASAPATAVEAAARDSRPPETPAAPARAVAGRDDPTAGQPVVIVDLRPIRTGGTLFVAADGRQWAQTSGILGGYPPVPFDATLRPGPISGSLLVFSDGSRRGRSVRVTLRE